MGLFDYLIVGPAKDREMRAAIDEKLKAAGRKPIKPLSRKNGNEKNGA